MAPLHVSLFGRFDARCGDQPVAGLNAGKAQELFCYLLLHRGRPCPREALASVLWDHTTTTQAKTYLRQTLWQLQSTLRAELDGEPREVISTTADWVQCPSETTVWLDVETLESAARAVEGVSGHQFTRAQHDRVEQAVRLYEGDLLENYYQDWCIAERERLRHLYVALLDKLATYCEANRLYETGRGYAERILTIDRAREQTHRQLMRLLYFSGDRTGAVRQFDTCVEALQAELDIPPAEATKELYTEIRTDHLRFLHRTSAAPAAPGSEALPPADQPDSPAEALREIETLLRHVTTLQGHLVAQVDSLRKMIDA